MGSYLLIFVARLRWATPTGSAGGRMGTDLADAPGGSLGRAAVGLKDQT